MGALHSDNEEGDRIESCKGRPQKSLEVRVPLPRRDIKDNAARVHQRSMAKRFMVHRCSL